MPELLELPGFDGDTLVCPVGSENSADWKPALAYPPFREALLSPAPRPAPPPPAKPAPTAPCPRCAAPNPERARYCNDCGGRMDGTVEPPPSPPPAAPAPLVTLTPVEAPTPAPMAPVPAVSARPPEAISPLEPSFVPPADVPVVALPPSPAPAPAPSPAPSATVAAAATDAASLRNTLLAAFIGASAASGALGYYLLRPHAAKVPANHEIEIPPPPAAQAPGAMPAAAPAVTPAPAPATAAVVPAAPVTAASPEPAAARPAVAESPAPAVEKAAPPRPDAPAAPKRARRAKRKRKPVEPPPAPTPSAPADDGNGGGESLIESRVNSLQGAAAEPKDMAPAKSAPLAPPEAEKPAEASAAAASSAPDGGFMLPGVPRPVGAKSVVKAPKSATAPAATAAAAEHAAAGAAPAAEDETSHQVREQFEFCAQLLAQGAYDDHFDTCLCAQTRNGAPYRGRRGLYSASLKKSAAAGKLETTAAISSIALDGTVAKVVARWKAGPDDKPRELAERWQLEDGLWCRAP